MKQLLLNFFIAVMAIQLNAQHLLPTANNTYDLGSSTFSWRDIYLDGIIIMDDVKFVSNAGIQSTFVGYQAGNVNTGSSNSALG